MKISNDLPKEGDTVLLPDNTIGILRGIKPNGLCFTDGINGETFTSFLHISKYKKIENEN
jgi:hypothetical protein